MPFYSNSLCPTNSQRPNSRSSNGSSSGRLFSSSTSSSTSNSSGGSGSGSSCSSNNSRQQSPALVKRFSFVSTVLQSPQQTRTNQNASTSLFNRCVQSPTRPSIQPIKPQAQLSGSKNHQSRKLFASSSSSSSSSASISSAAAVAATAAVSTVAQPRALIQQAKQPRFQRVSQVEFKAQQTPRPTCACQCDCDLRNAITNSRPLYHSRVDYRHFLVPDLLRIVNSPFYWGKMDRHEAERLLADRPEGTFLLRDSAQPQHLFSISFRRFNQSLHARIEQHEHRFGFDPQDPGVYNAHTICDLLEYYKQPSHCVFFEPVLTRPLCRDYVFSLKDLSRARIASQCKYEDIEKLQLPTTLCSYLRYYKYKCSVREFNILP